MLVKLICAKLRPFSEAHFSYFCLYHAPDLTDMAPDLIAPVRARLPDLVVTLEAAAGLAIRASALEASGEVLPVHAFLLSTGTWGKQN